MIGHTTSLCFLMLSICCVAGSQIIIKGRYLNAGFDSTGVSFGNAALVVISDPFMWLAGIMFTSGAALWYLALTKLQLGFMMPAAAMVAPLAAIGAHFFLGDVLTLQKTLAIAVITIGVIWLGLQMN